MVKILQVLPGENHTVYCYFSDGRVKLYDAKPLIDKGGVFATIDDPAVFTAACTVMNGTLAWDIKGDRDPFACLDVDPDTLYAKGIEVADPLSRPA